MNDQEKKHVIVIGAGAAGLMAAVMAARAGCRVTVLERNEKAGKKIYITGKGRCNFTNACAPEEFFSNVRRNNRFLYSSFYGMTNEDVIALFESAGMQVKIERGNRAFPVSDHASDVTGSLLRLLNREGVQIRYGVRVRRLLTANCEDPLQEDSKEDHRDDAKDASTLAPKKASKGMYKETSGEIGRLHVTGVALSGGEVLLADAVIVCTGGLSYPSTGSTGDGYLFAEDLGHRVSTCLPSLVPLCVREEALCRQLQGLSLRNVRLRMTQGKKTLYEEQGEMLFTHFGVSGPLVLTASTLLPLKESIGKKNEKKADTKETEGFDTTDLCLHIDLKPALTEKQLDERLLRDIDAAEKKQVKNMLGGLYPAKLVPIMISLAGIDAETKCHSLTRQQREALGRVTKDLTLRVTGTRGFSEAIITRGGVDVKQIRPDTMESKLVGGLFFAGEVLDLDAVTGGFNLQIAWSTGAAAGRGVAKSEKET